MAIVMACFLGVLLSKNILKNIMRKCKKVDKAKIRYIFIEVKRE